MAIMVMMKLNRRYLAIRGIVNAGGNILEISKRNTTKASRMEIHMVIFSPPSPGSANVQTLAKEINTHGMIRLTM